MPVQRKTSNASEIPLAKRRHMARQFRAFGPGFVSPEWANADGLEEAAERKMEEVLADESAWAEITSEAISKSALDRALKKLHEAVQDASQPEANSWHHGRVRREAQRVNDCLIDAAYRMAKDDLDDA